MHMLAYAHAGMSGFQPSLRAGLGEVCNALLSATYAKHKQLTVDAVAWWKQAQCLTLTDTRSHPSYNAR